MIYLTDKQNSKETFNMIGLLKKLFGGKPAEHTAEAPYKVETAPVVEAAPAPSVEAVVVVPEAVVPAAVITETTTKQTAKKPAPKKQQFAKKPAAPKKEAAPKAAPTKSTGTRKPKAKPAV